MMKELVAVSILELGQNKLGVRLPSMLLGASTIPLVAFLAWKLSNKNGKVTVLSAILMAFNPLLSGLSSVGLLDTGEMFFFLCGFALYFSDLMKQRPGQKFVLVGVLFGLSTLSKEVGILPFLAFATIHLVSHRNASSLKEVAFSTVGLALTVIIGFQTYDSIFTSFPSFLDHIWYLIAYASNIRGYYVSEPPSTWLINLSSSDLSSGLGVTSVLLSVPLLVWVPMMFANLVRKKMSEYVFPFVLFLWTYVPYFVIWYLGRDEKAFYAIQMSPALAIGAAFSFTFFQRKMLPGKPQVILVVCFTAFFIYLYYFLS
jgi:4-amino-4-deoxy-L-arabinose transferase-like glycosyltransferase